jgi:hypothetical protein
VAGISKAERKKRAEFMRKLLEEGCSVSYSVRQYDLNFGTHYWERTFPAEAEWRRAVRG